MGNLHVTKGHRIFLANTLEDLLNPDARIWLEEVQETPDKSTEPEYVDAPAIHLRKQRRITGVPNMPDSIQYTLNFDPTPQTGNFDVVLDLLGTSLWIFEEYVDSGKEDKLGDGYLYYGKIESISQPGQQLNNLQTFGMNVSNLFDDDYYVRFTDDDPQVPTYRSVLTGNIVEQPKDPNSE